VHLNGCSTVATVAYVSVAEVETAVVVTIYVSVVAVVAVVANVAMMLVAYIGGRNSLRNVNQCRLWNAIRCSGVVKVEMVAYVAVVGMI
jgi:hypothetical protein